MSTISRRHRGLAVLLAATIGGVACTRDAPSRPGPSPNPLRHYVVHFDNAPATFDRIFSTASGVLRFSTGPGSIDAVSFGFDSVRTDRGETGPISVLPGTEAPRATARGANVNVRFDVRLMYPLLYDLGGESRAPDAVVPQRLQRASATFEGRIFGGRWIDTVLRLVPDPVEGTDFNLPRGRIVVRSTAAFQTALQLAAGNVFVYCVEIRRETDAVTDEEMANAIRELRDIWRSHRAYVLVRREITELNTRLLRLRLGPTEAREPSRIPTDKCYAFDIRVTSDPPLVADAARRTITIGRNATAACPASTFGRLMAHGLGHIALRTEAEEPVGAEDNLMRPCAPGSALDAGQLARRWSYVAEVPTELTLPGQGARRNALGAELEARLGTVPPVPVVTPSPTPSASPSPSVAATGTAQPAITPTPAPEATPVPTPEPTPEPTPPPTPTPGPTPSPSPTPSPTGGRP